MISLLFSGLIGSKLPKFSLFGDTMNTSSRMESTSRPGCIQISESTYAMLEEDQQSLFEATGGVEVKGKGLMPTYIYQPTEEALKLPSIQDESPSSPEKGKNNLLVSATESLEDSSQTPNGSGRSPNQGSKRRSSVSYPIAWMLAQNHPAAETDGASKWHNYTKSGRSQELPLFALPLTSKNYPVGAPNATLSPVDRPMSNLLALGENLDHDTSNAHPPLQHRSTGLVSRDGEWSRANSGIPSSSGRAPDLNRVSSKDAPSTLALLFNKQTSRISPSFDEKEEKEEVKDEEKDEVREMTTVLPPPAPVRRKPVKRNTLQSLTAAFSNLQQPLP